MGRSATRIVASILAALLAGSCGTVKEAARPNAVGRVFIPRAARLVASPVVEELELRRALEELLPAVDVETVRADLRRLVVDPRFHGRSPEKFRVVLASWGSGPVALEEIGRGYRAHCAAEHRTNCLEGPLTDSSVYKIAFDFAMGSQWDGFVGELKTTIDPSTIQIVLLTGLVIFMATIAIPELTSKIPAAAATMVLTAYLGARAVCDLIFGWIQMVKELDAARTFDEVRAAGQRYGHLVGAQTARTLVLLATAAIAQGGLIARLMRLPRAAQASTALAAETGGTGLEAVAAVKEVRVVQSGVAITVVGVAKGAVSVTMAGQSAPQRGPNAAPPAKAANKLPWRPWGEYEKVTVGGREYAKIGDRLYTRHAVDRLQPSGLGTPAGGRPDAGRSISPTFVEDVIQNGATQSQVANGVERTIHTLGTVQVVTEQGGRVVITVNPFSGRP